MHSMCAQVHKKIHRLIKLHTRVFPHVSVLSHTHIDSKKEQDTNWNGCRTLNENGQKIAGSHKCRFVKPYFGSRFLYLHCTMSE
ncbi:hypothetical protein GDO78_008787 [Eleutherodactylus coqui]|uniref:Uncharacterized protein n=1 Tax=Eleutherodactylus coqui TaxID=57060 RepID=A0A8J6FE01_ELECQ|nr:hypothetical protein GDO78_008787 [Eleutherodactylus coqui]